MKKRVMITTIFSSRSVKIAAHKLKPDKIICVVEKDYDKIRDKNLELKRNAIKNLIDSFGDIIEIKILRTKSIYDIYEITKDVIKKIDELSEHSEILLNITEGRKTLSFGLIFAAYSRKEKIEGIYYVIEETNEIIKLPLLDLSVNETQKEILNYIKEGVKNIDSLMKKLNKSKSIIYQYVKELQNAGYINNKTGELNITELGKIMIL